MGIIKYLGPGSWWLQSKTDKRWNAHGYSDAVGMYSQPLECREKQKELEELYGTPPEDLEWGYMKD